MRTLPLAVVAIGAVLVLSPAAWAQQDQGRGLGESLDQLNRMVNPESPQNQPRAREDTGSSSTRDDRRDSDYRRYSDSELRNEAARLNDEERQLQRQRRDIEDEMNRRGVRR